MPSFFYLDRYFFWSNLLVGLAFFGAVYGWGSFILRIFRYTPPTPQKQILAATLGFLVLSLVIQFLAFGFWITPLTLSCLYGLLAIGLLYTLGNSIKIYTSTNGAKFSFSNSSKLLGAVCLLCVSPILLYALLPSTKIDELFYHQLVAQRIVIDGGLIFYRQPWEAAIPPHLLHHFTQVPLVGLGFTDAPNIVSFCFLGLFLWSVYQWMQQAQVPLFWIGIGLSLSCLGMYRLVFTSAGSHHLGDLVSFTAFYLTLYFNRLSNQQSVKSLTIGIGLLLPAILGAKMSLAPYAALIGIAAVFELYRHKRLSGYHLFLLGWPTLVFYLPIVVWTYVQTHSPFGLILSQYFDTKIIDKNLLTSTLQAEIVNTPTFLEHTQTALMHFPFLVLGGFILFGWSRHPLRDKVKMYTLAGFFLLILYKFDLLYSPRFWGNLPLSFFLATLLSLPLWAKKLTNRFIKIAIIVTSVLPYVGLTYLYLYNLRPLPFTPQQRDYFYRRFLPFYDDFRALNAILPKDACLYTQERLNLVHAPRRIFRDSLDVCHCQEIYALDFKHQHLPSTLSMQKHIYTFDKLIYHNPTSVITTYRTPNRKPKTEPLNVYKLKIFRP